MVSSIARAGAPDILQAEALIQKSESGCYPWIVSPLIDFLFVFGGLVWICILFNCIFIGWNVPLTTNVGVVPAKFIMSVVFFSQYAFADPHTAATYMRIYGTAENRKRFNFYCLYLPLLCIPVFAYGVFGGGAGVLVFIYMITVYWHYASQSFGLALIYCYKQGYMMSKLEREIFRGFMQSMIAFVFCRMLAYTEFYPRYFYGVTLPHWGMLPEWCFYAARFCFIIMAAAFGCVIIKKAIVDRSMIPLTAVIMIATVSAIGLSSGTLSSLLWIYGPPFFHGSQYVAISMAYYLKERGLPSGSPSSYFASLFFRKETLIYLAWIIPSGLFIYAGIPWLFQHIGYDYFMVAGVCLATFNFHHFITDAAIWRLRDAKCRAILVA